MSAKFFVDSNILVYVPDLSAGAKHLRAKALVEQLWTDRSGVLSPQVLQEFYVSVRKKASDPLRSTEAKQWIADYLNWQLVINVGKALLEAIELEARYKISFRDALIVQAANTVSATLLYSENLSHGQRYAQVTVENPLLPD